MAIPMMLALMNLGNTYIETTKHKLQIHELQAILMFILHNIIHSHVILWGDCQYL